MKVSKEEMKKAGIDLAYRDFCAHLLIPLNECRRKSFFLPWKCGDERHVYEKCQYEECVFRCCCFLMSLSLLLLFFSRVYLSSLMKERAFRVSFDVCFSPEREREKRGRRFRDSRTDFFATFPEYLPQVYETRAKDEGATRRGIERERERGKVRSFLRVGIVYLVVVVIFV